MTNLASEWTSFIYDNGQFTLLDWPFGTGTWTYPLKILNDGQIFGMFDLNSEGYDGGPSEPLNVPGYFVYDDGRFYKVVLPATMNGLTASWDVNGMNKGGELTGTWRTTVCNPPGSFNCTFTRKGFVATPRSTLAVSN